MSIVVPITDHAEATALLADARYIPPPVPQDAPQGTLAWLRAQVSRFCTGEVHAERRQRVERELAALDPAALRTAARAATLERDGDWRGVPATVLGAALGVPGPARADLVAAVVTAATGYLSGDSSPETDAAVAELVELLDPHPHERDDPYPQKPQEPQDPQGVHGAVSGGTIARITVLLQAHAATETLIRNALGHAEPDVPIEGILYETLRHDPPVKALNRIDEKTGGRVTIDVVAANRDPRVFTDPDRFDAARGPAPHLTFGSGLRPCPAPAHALALAAGVLEAVPG